MSVSYPLHVTFSIVVHHRSHPKEVRRGNKIHHVKNVVLIQSKSSVCSCQAAVECPNVHAVCHFKIHNIQAIALDYQ